MIISRKIALDRGWAILAASLAGLTVLLMTDPMQVKPSDAWWQGALLTLFYTGLGYFLYRLSRLLEFFNAEEVLGTLVVMGTATTALMLIPGVLNSLGLATLLPTAGLLVTGALQVTFQTAYFFGGALLLSRLLLHKAGPNTYRWWQAFVLIAGLSNLSLFNGQHTLTIDKVCWLIAGAIPALVVATRIQWLAIVRRESQVRTAIMLGIALLLTFTLIWQMLTPQTSPFGPPLAANPVMLFSTGFLSLSLVLSLSGLLFHLPLAPIVAANREAMSAFGAMGQMTRDADGQESILALLAAESARHTTTRSYWVSALNPEAPDHKWVLQEGISDADIRRIEYTLYSHPEHFGLSTAQQYMYVKDIQSDTHLQYHILPGRSLLAYTLRPKEGQAYRLYLLHSRPQAFDEQQLELITAYAQQSLIALQNVTMIQQALQAERLRNDLEIGKRVQQRLLPESFPPMPRMDIFATSAAAEEVGGDYYDHYLLPDQRLAIVMADVSGKGTTAAFHVAEMKGIFQTLILSEQEPAPFLAKANTAVGRCFDKGMFITLVYGILDRKARQFRYVRAGHCPVMHYSAASRTLHTLQDDGLGLGILRNDEYDTLITEQTVSVQPGDLLILFTDGITEARHPETKKEYGYQRLHDCILLHLDLSAEKMTQKVLQDVNQFIGDTSNRDDMSILIVKC